MRMFEEEIKNMDAGGKIGKSGRFEPPVKIKRQGLIITLNQLHKLIDELENEFPWDGPCKVTDDDRKFQINIINQEGLSDTWEIELDNQRKKVGTALGKPLETRKKAGADTNNDMPVDLDNHADNPQDDPGQTSGVANGDTGDSTFPADSKYNEKWDSHYDEGKDIWLEPPCQYEDCEFCSRRPNKPSECVEDS